MDPSSAATRAEQPPAAGLAREAELVAVLDSVPVGVLLFDAQGRLTRSNERFQQLTAVDPQALYETDPPAASDFEALLEALRSRVRNPKEFAARWRALHEHPDEPSVEEIELLSAPGAVEGRPAGRARRLLERFSRPLTDPEGNVLGRLEVYRDLSEQRLLQNKMVQTEKMAALGQLVSGIAHELNNPLTSIMGYAQLLLSRQRAAPPVVAGSRRAREVEDAERICQEAERAARLVKNLLLFARGARPERRPADLNEIVQRTLALRSYELRVENIAVELELAPELPPALADPHQVQQVILNLLVNAEQALVSRPEDATPQQSAAAGARIVLRTRSLSAQRVAVEVADNGPGIPPTAASRIFDPFFTTKPLGVGTGLGLSIAYGIVQEHGGDIYVESHPGHGATFVVELPAAAAEPAAEPALHGEAAPQHAPGPGRRILVVEDEPTVARLVRDVLSEEGHHVEAVLDSTEGLERARRTGYDLVICDLRMPRLDGRAFYQALVEDGSPLRDRVVFITGDTLAPRTLEFLTQHNIPYLAKPFLVEELTLLVSRALASRTRDGGEVRGSRPAPPRRAGRA